MVSDFRADSTLTQLKVQICSHDSTLTQLIWLNSSVRAELKLTHDSSQLTQCAKKLLTGVGAGEGAVKYTCCVAFSL